MFCEDCIMAEFPNSDTVYCKIARMSERTDTWCKYYREKMKIDNVNKPSHYCQGNIETIDYLQSCLTAEEFKGFLKGNIIKYTSRERLKGGLEDCKKAEWYLRKLIQVMEDKPDGK